MKAEELLEHDGAWRTISLWDGGLGGCSFGAHSQLVAMESGSSVRGQQAVLGVGGWEWVPGWDMELGGKEEAQKCLVVMICCTVDA